MANKAFFDCETSGKNSATHDIIEMGIVITNQKLDIIAQEVFQARPLSVDAWEREAEEIHGISIMEAVRFPRPYETCIDVMDFFEEYSDGETYEWVDHSDVPFHDGGFDLPFFEHMYRKQSLEYQLAKYVTSSKRESTVVMARKAGYKNNKLSKWAERLECHWHKHHKAISDTLMCLELYKFLKSGKRYIEVGQNLELF